MRIEYTDDISNGYYGDNTILKLLSGFTDQEKLSSVVELLIIYAGKSEENAKSGMGFIQNEYSINQYETRYGYVVTLAICSELKKYADDDNPYVREFVLGIIEFYLGFEFRQTEAQSRTTYVSYTISLTDNEAVIKYRNICWEIVCSYYRHPKLQNRIERILLKYVRSINQGCKLGIIENDKKNIETLIAQMDNTVFRKAFICYQMMKKWELFKLTFAVDRSLFGSYEWRIFLLIDEKEHINKLEDFDCDKKEKCSELVSFARKMTAPKISHFIKAVDTICRDIRILGLDSKIYTFGENIETICSELCVSPKKVEKMMDTLMAIPDCIEINPSNFISCLFQVKDAKQVWEFISSKQYAVKNKWQFYYFDRLPLHMVNEYTYNLLLNFLKDDEDRNITQSHFRNMHFMDKFLMFDRNAYVSATSVILKKISYSKYIVGIYLKLLFNSGCFTPDELIQRYESDLNLLRETYFTMFMNNSLVDVDGAFIVNFIKLGKEWINQFAECCTTIIQNNSEIREGQMQALWKSDEYILVFDSIYEKLSNQISCLGELSVAEAFKVILAGKSKDIVSKQIEWVKHIVDKYANSDKVCLIFVAISESDVQIKKIVLQEFLSLNSNFELFKKLCLISRHCEGFDYEVIQAIQNKIDYLKSIRQFVQGVKYLKHAQYISLMIKTLENEKKQEENELYYRDL